jgi:Protein containing von Willebrand factor type A (vWA) domain
MAMRSPVTTEVVPNLLRFARYLRARGLRLGPGTSRDLVEAARIVGFADRDDLRAALAAVAVTRPADVPPFEEAFARFFLGAGPGPAGRDEPDATTDGEEVVHGSLPVLADVAGAPPTASERLEEIVGGSWLERLATRDFGELTAAEAAEVRLLIARMMWRPAEAMSRRWRPARDGTRPDLRRTLRRMTGPAGDLIPLARARRRPRRRPLVVIADVSGSMERYTEMFLHFVHAAQGRLGRVEAFVFATRLTHITREMRRRSPGEALARVSGVVQDWSGGTRIGEALRVFNREWSRRVTRGGAIALVISDGWDTGDPELLGQEMARLSRSVHRVVWLNPLAGRPGFAPETRGMRAALPYVDDLLAAASVRDLREVVQLLESLPARRGGVASRSRGL